MRISLGWWGVALAGGLAVMVWARKLRSPLPLAAWMPGLVKRHGNREARRLVALAEERCRQLIAGISPQASPALRAQLVKNILPGLALYQTLLDAHSGLRQPSIGYEALGVGPRCVGPRCLRQAALAEIEPLFQAWTNQLYGSMMRTFRILPFPFFFFRLGFAFHQNQLADNIFKTSWIENSPRRIAMDQFGCPYLNTLTAHGVPELAPYYCQIDDWMAELLPPQIAFRRTQTLARGGDRCDFRYEKAA